ncbi:MAG TPA: hypothetical protein PLS93_16485 [Accumulibacter sp.]|nr:hypothetical protein [Accumulibacter sp.]
MARTWSTRPGSLAAAAIGFAGAAAFFPVRLPGAAAWGFAADAVGLFIDNPPQSNRVEW